MTARHILPFPVALLLAGCPVSVPPVTDGATDVSDAGTTSDTSTDAQAPGDATGATDVTDATARDVSDFVPDAEPGRHNVTVGETVQVIPGPGLPAETVAMNSNNNLDVVRHTDGRIYLAWRTGPDHYASDAVRMNVISSTDEQTWRFEAQFSAGEDLREPRLLSSSAGLFLYLARLGTNPLSFDPQGMSYTTKLPDGTWSPLTAFYEPGFIGWRARVEHGQNFLLAYKGGEHIYDFSGLPLDVEMLTSTDGTTWTGVNPSNPVIYHGGGSETDFTLGDDGTLFGVIRNEAGDDTGFGSKVCRAPAGDHAAWVCHTDPKKYDSPLMFWYDGEAYLIARRNLTVTGNYDLFRTNLDFLGQQGANQLDYHMRRKRCSVWRYDQANDRIAFLTDLPSRGDTCFPAMIPGTTPGDFIVYNYSSDINGPDVDWATGQQGHTLVYRTVLHFTRRP